MEDVYVWKHPGKKFGCSPLEPKCDISLLFSPRESLKDIGIRTRIKSRIGKAGWVSYIRQVVRGNDNKV